MQAAAAPALPERRRGRSRPTAALAMAVSPRERARRRLVAAIAIVYLLAIFEGAIRKYVAPQFGQYIFFIRDPFLIYAYGVATVHGLWPRNSVLFKISVFMCGFGLLLFAMQSAVFGLDTTRLILGIYGWRSYFLYVPLAFLIGAQFNSTDLTRFVRLTLALAVPIALLVVLQFSSPPNAPINVGVAEEQELQFKSVGITGERIRTTGPFTTTSAQQQFIATSFSFVLAMLLAAKRPVGMIFLAVTASATLTCLALSGSRGAMLQCGLSGLFALGIVFIGRGAAVKAKALWLPMALGFAALALYPIVFPAGFETFMVRWDGAAAAESRIEGGIFGRAILGLFHFTTTIQIVPALGYGLGYGGNASIILGAVVDGIKPGLLVEADFSRHMVDLGPLFGLAYIAFRVAVAVWLARLVFLATRRSTNPLAMLLFSYVSYTLVFGQITGQGTINVFGWLMTGLCIAATREACAARPAPQMRRAAAPVGVDRLGAQGRRPRPYRAPRLPLTHLTSKLG